MIFFFFLNFKNIQINNIIIYNKKDRLLTITKVLQNYKKSFTNIKKLVQIRKCIIKLKSNTNLKEI